MRYFPLSDTRGLILNDEDLPLTIQHDPDTEVMSWTWGEGKPTIFNRQAAEDYIEIITGYPEWIAVPHPQNKAIRQAAAAILDSNVKGARYRSAEFTGATLLRSGVALNELLGLKGACS